MTRLKPRSGGGGGGASPGRFPPGNGSAMAQGCQATAGTGGPPISYLWGLSPILLKP